ncbi:MAG: hypothetical protein K8823_160 [Cenarchaeum symbiont of Oopsacas minuta]|nr:hypothetical protein [Cenarchaeum symbiont of Oopsacas minuta]
MIPLVAIGIAFIATITVGTILGFMIDGAELAMTSKEITAVQNLKGSENLDVLIKDGDLVIHNKGIESSHVIAIKTMDGVGIELIQAYETTLNPTSDIVVSGNYSEKDVYVITSLGNIFAASGNLSLNSVSSGSVGTHMNIVQVSTKGSIISGNREQLGIERTVQPYSAAHQTDDYAFVLGDVDVSKVMSIPTFDGSYYYLGHIIKKQDGPNILGYVSKSHTGNTHAVVNHDYLMFYGIGQIMVKLDPQLANQTILLSGTIRNGSMIEISGRPNNSASEIQTVLRISAAPENISVQSDHVTNLNAAFDDDVSTYATVKSNQNEIIFDFETLSYRTIGSMNIDLDRSDGHRIFLCIYVDTNGKAFEKIAKYNIYHHTNNAIDVNYEGLFRYLKIVDCYNSSYIAQVDIREINTAFVPNKPGISTSMFGDNMYYKTTLSIPYSANLTVTTNSFYVILVRGEIPNFDSPRFEITGLAANTPYRIERDGFTSAISITASDGSISLPTADVDFDTGDSAGGVLRLYPNSTGHVGEFNTLMLDAVNDKVVQLAPLEDGKLIYVPHAYVRWVLPAASTIENVLVDEIALSYLNANYEAGSAIMIPIVPGTKKMHATVDGINMTVQLAHIAATTQIVPIQENMATNARYGVGDSTVYTTTEASTSTFVTASHTGKTYGIIDINGISGSATFTMNSNYTGELAKAHGSYNKVFPVRSTKSVGYWYYFPPPESISNMNSLATNHANELIIALNRGQISALVAEVDVYKNFKHIKTERIYKANAGTASVVSNVINATYDTLPFSPSRYYDNGGLSKFNTMHQVHIEYSPMQTSHIAEVDVNAGDMIEFVVRVGLDAHGTPVPTIDEYSSGVHATSTTSAYVHTAAGFTSGSIIVGMS